MIFTCAKVRTQSDFHRGKIPKYQKKRKENERLVKTFPIKIFTMPFYLLGLSEHTDKIPAFTFISNSTSSTKEIKCFAQADLIRVTHTP